MNTEEIKEITSLEEFVRFILNSRKSNSDMNIYYRGESSYFEYRLPSLYRNTLLLERSERYYRTLMNEMGWEDYSDNADLVRRMAELQHYGAKTRLLDITSNPLVALYFAVENASENDEQKNNQEDKEAGYVYFYGENPDDEKFDIGHTVAIKTAINLIPSYKIDYFCDVMSILFDVYQGRRLMYLRFTTEDWISSLRRSFQQSNEFKWSIDITNDDLLKVVLERNGKIEEGVFPLVVDLRDFGEEFETKFNLSIGNLEELMCYVFEQIIDEFLELLNQRAKTKERLIYPMRIFLDLIKTQIILPAKNTDRLKQQQGAFIYPGIHKVDILKENMGIISERIDEKAIKISDNQNEEFSKIKISPCNKFKIKEELSILGITSGFIYPDLQHLADSALEKIKKENHYENRR